MQMRSKVIPAATVVAAVAMAAMLGNAQESAPAPVPSDLTSLSVFADGVDAYIYGYPLLMLGMTERVATTTPTVKANLGRAPLNQFTKSTGLPDGSYQDVVLPSTSTLYASSFINLSNEPVILHLPVIDRFYLMQMLDAWTNVSEASPGTRRGSQEGDYALVGPDWKGTLPSGIPAANVINMPTNTMWIIGRIFTSGTPTDLSHVANDIIPYLTLKPLSAYNTNYTEPDNIPIDPSIDTTTTPLHQVSNMDACAFFGTMSAMLSTNMPVLPQDERTVARLAKIGVVPGKPFDCANVDGTTKAALQVAVQVAKERLSSAQGSLSPTVTNWLMPLNVGDYGRRYLLRAVVANKALGANLPQDAVYGYATLDGNSNALKGNKQYKVHFNAPTARRRAGELPPVNDQGFWSVTIYKADGTLVDNKVVSYNAIGVGTLGPTIQNHSACFNSDGSLDLYLQSDQPMNGAQTCNWIPTPPTNSAVPATEADFIVFLRMYWPDQAVLRGRWVPPAVQQIN